MIRAVARGRNLQSAIDIEPVTAEAHLDLRRAKTIGLFGGTFDPIHFGHLILAERAREEMALDAVLFVPANIPPHKRVGRRIAPPDCRIEMLRLATASNRSFCIEDHEIDREGISYTYDTLVYLRGLYPKAEFTLLIGADNARDFRTWYRPEEIVTMAKHGVWGRPGSELPAELMPGVPLRRIDAPLIEISSTDIRERVAAGRSVRYLTPESVVEYIAQQGLYR
jgi:nicotinate-nucleotide adenylyltransferase